jgi:hypothetical protein
MADELSACDAAAPAAASPLEKLTRAQVFARDPEALSDTDLAFAIEELKKINLRNRKARADDAFLAETATKMKKANTATRKKKGAAVMAADILDVKL